MVRSPGPRPAPAGVSLPFRSPAELRYTGLLGGKRMDKIGGDPAGIAALKALVAENRDYLRFLLGEAKTNVDHTAPFTGPDGVKYLLRADPVSGRLEISRADRPPGA